MDMTDLTIQKPKTDFISTAKKKNKRGRHGIILYVLHKYISRSVKIDNRHAVPKRIRWYQPTPSETYRTDMYYETVTRATPGQCRTESVRHIQLWTLFTNGENMVAVRVKELCQG